MTPLIPERIRLFKMVRDIPYFIAVNDGEQGYDCVTKPELLDRLLQTIGIKSRHIVCEFLWEDLNLPGEMIELPHEKPETHEYLEVLIPETNQWVKVDPTWDGKLQWPKLPIAEWNGLSDTALAVRSTKTYTLEESLATASADSGEEREKYMARNKKFFIAFNQWLESIRKKT